VGGIDAEEGHDERKVLAGRSEEEDSGYAVGVEDGGRESSCGVKSLTLFHWVWIVQYNITLYMIGRCSLRMLPIYIGQIISRDVRDVYPVHLMKIVFEVAHKMLGICTD